MTRPGRRQHKQNAGAWFDVGLPLASLSFIIPRCDRDGTVFIALGERCWTVTPPGRQAVTTTYYAHVSRQLDWIDPIFGKGSR